MFRLFQFALVTLVAGIFGCWQIESYSQEIPWRTDPESAISQAANANKFVLYHFYADWCRPCKQLDTFVFRSPAVVRAIDHNVIPVKVDVDLHPDLVKRYGITGIPADVIITPSGRIVKQRTSPVHADGYAEMLNQLAKVDHQLKAGNKALAQNIDEVLALAKPDTSRVLDHNNFAANAPSHEQPAPSKDSADMARKFAKKFDTTTGKLTTSDDDLQRVYVDMTQAQGAQSQAMPSNNVFNASASPITPAAKSGTQHEIARSSPVRITNERFLSGNVSVQDRPPQLKEFSTGGRFAKTKIGNSSSELRASQIPNRGPVQQVNNVTTTQATDPATQNSRFALQGKCPVSLIKKGKWIDGDPQFGCVHRGKLYLFADESKLVTFRRDPDGYSPLLAGHDPVIYFERGELVNGLEQHGVFMGKLPNQRVILFNSPETREKFQQEPRRYLTVVQQAVKMSDEMKTR